MVFAAQFSPIWYRGELWYKKKNLLFAEAAAFFLPFL